MAVPEALRARIRELEGGVAVRRKRLPSGVPAVDALVGGIPRPGILEVSGLEGTGRARIAALLAAEVTRRGSPVAWIDPARRVYPPGLAALGVDLGQLLVVRPPEDGSAPWAWATEQIARSGCFPLVVLDQPVVRGVRRAFALGFARAAEQGGATLVVLGTRPMRDLPAEVRLGTTGDRLVVLRDRGGDVHALGTPTGPMPALPLAADPFPETRIPDTPLLPTGPPGTSREAPADPWWTRTDQPLPMPSLPRRARLARGQRRKPA